MYVLPMRRPPSPRQPKVNIVEVVKHDKSSMEKNSDDKVGLNFYSVITISINVLLFTLYV